jgi:excisionase family DNA binding protein
MFIYSSPEADMATEQTIEERIRRMTPVTAPPEQHDAVAALSSLLERVAPRRRGKCQLVAPDGQAIPIPESAFYLFERVAEVLARGDAITIVPVGKELTTQQAAGLLNVSRQYLVRLMNEKKIPYTKVGKHRRLRIEDVLSFKERRDRDRRAGLRELSQVTQEFGGYDAELK